MNVVVSDATIGGSLSTVQNRQFVLGAVLPHRPRHVR